MADLFALRQARVVLGDRPVLHDPEKVVPEADVLFIESTYGDRLHRPFAETEDEIVAAFERTRHTHGNLIMPAFAVVVSVDTTWPCALSTSSFASPMSLSAQKLNAVPAGGFSPRN